MGMWLKLNDSVPQADGVMSSTPVSHEALPVASLAVDEGNDSLLEDLVEFIEDTETKERTTVRFQGSGSAVLVQVRLTGPSGDQIYVQMAVDTGATYSMVDPAILSKIGVLPTEAQTKLATVGGIVKKQLAVVESISVDDVEISGGLTVAACAACSTGNSLGLLGLNFLRHFTVTVDHGSRMMTLVRNSDRKLPPLDPVPFVAINQLETRRSNGRVKIRFAVRNLSPRTITGIRLVASRADMPRLGSEYQAIVSELLPGGEVDTTIEGPIINKPGIYGVRAVAGYW